MYIFINEYFGVLSAYFLLTRDNRNMLHQNNEACMTKHILMCFIQSYYLIGYALSIFNKLLASIHMNILI